MGKLDSLGIAENTIVIFAGDNGADRTLLHRGHSGFFDGSYFTGMEGSLRTPCIARWPSRIPAGRKSNEIFHITDWFPTLTRMAGVSVPDDRIIDGKDQTAFLLGEQEESNREGFIFWNGEQMFGVKWRNLKLALFEQRDVFDPAVRYGTPNIRDLIWDPTETQPHEPRFFHGWSSAHFGRLIAEFHASLQAEPLIPAGAPLDFVPCRSGDPPPGGQASAP